MTSQSASGSSLDFPPMVVPAHKLARWVHSKLEVRDGVMRWELPRTVLGIVPVGGRVIEIPAAEITRIGVRRGIQPVGMVAGLAVIVLPFVLGWGWWAILTVVFGTWVILVASGPRIEAETRTGRTHRANVCFEHQIDADLYMTAVEDISTDDS